MPDRTTLHVRGRGLPDGEPVEWWIAGGVLRSEPVADAETVWDGGWIIPGLVDAHCHVGLGPHGETALDEAIAQAEVERDAGALLLRDCGSPTDTRALDDHADLPRIIRAGRHLARPRRYGRGHAIELEDEWDLPAALAEQARHGDGWVKLVGDWIDRESGDLAPCWPADVLAQAVAAAHEEGARVTAHCFGEESLRDLAAAGADCVEHACGLEPDTIDTFARQGIAIVPTLVNIDTFPQIAEPAREKFPDYHRHMIDLHARRFETIGHAVDAGVPVFAGTDAGTAIPHGLLPDEVELLAKVGGAAFALGAASWRARAWLGVDGVTEGASADLVVFDDDPRAHLGALRDPRLVILRGRVVRVRHG